MNKKVGIVFISGAGLNSNIWSKIAKKLPCPSIAVDFGNNRESYTFEDYINLATDQINNHEDFKPNQKEIKLILVAHSVGGCIALSLLNKFSDRIIGIVGVAATFPKPNQSFISSQPFPQKFILPLVLRFFGTKPPDNSILHEYCNDLTDTESKKVLDGFVPESRSLYVSKLSYQKPAFKCAYIKSTMDNSMSDSIQNIMASNLDCSNIATIDSGHLPMISQPMELSSIINNIISEITH